MSYENDMKIIKENFNNDDTKQEIDDDTKQEIVEIDDDIKQEIKEIEDALIQYYNVLAFKCNIKEYQYKYKKILTMFNKQEWNNL